MCVLYTHIWKTSLKGKMKLICGNEKQLHHGASPPPPPAVANEGARSIVFTSVYDLSKLC